MRPVNPRYFGTPSEWRDWLEKHHATAPEVWVGFHKRGSGRPSITWPESVDQALCFGWIDGIRRRVDDAPYTTRYSTRRKGSRWSNTNLERVEVRAPLGDNQRAVQAGHGGRSAAKIGI